MLPLLVAYVPNDFERMKGEKVYETKTRGKAAALKAYFLNVLLVTTDPIAIGLKLGQEVGTADDTTDYYLPEVVAATEDSEEYAGSYAFGMAMSGRTWQAGTYRYRRFAAANGFQGQEGDDEMLGEGNALAFKYRVHDARLGRFLSVDPLAPKYPWNSTYAFAENRVVDGVELEGLETVTINSPTYANKFRELFKTELASFEEVENQMNTARILALEMYEKNYDEEGNLTGQIYSIDFSQQERFKMVGAGGGLIFEMENPGKISRKSLSDYERWSRSLEGSFDGANAGDIFSDRIAIAAGFSDIFGVGPSVSIEFGWVKNQGFGLTVSPGFGFGLDVGPSLSFSAGKYTGADKPNWSDLMGASAEFNASLGIGGGYSGVLGNPKSGDPTFVNWHSGLLSVGTGPGISAKYTYTFKLVGATDSPE
jgi:RHS repeat-associated protein